VKLYPERNETAAGMDEAMQAGLTTSVQIVEACLSRIDDRDSELHAWVSVDREGARATAAERDRERATGTVRGPLHGIPIGIKDIINVAGMVTGAGSPLMSKGPTAERDAELVARLRDAGAVILGKTVTTQFACFDPPPTRNPWNLAHTPGGSSSGSAAAVAAGMCPVAIGSQTGGSITRPASFCGVFGCKPTFGTVSVDGVVPIARSLDHPGPIARSVEDLAIVVSVLQGSLQGSQTSELAVSNADQPPPRIGRLRGFHEDLVAPELKSAINRTLDALMTAGCLVYDIDVPVGFDELPENHKLIMAAGAAAWHRERFAEHRDDYGPCVASLIEEGLSASATDYIKALDHQAVMSERMNALFGDGLDVLLTPATTGPAPDRSSTGNPAMNAPWSYTGLPTVSLPIALSADGLPLAVQLAGRRYDDAELLRAAAFCESVLAPGS
jgi:Asp-tRNA(Asn)/Glu-tRNA(Gln) amidotransferase A subunit family amidase